MIIAHYANRLPKNYDLGPIRTLTRERGPIWDVRPELYFKAFLLREAGRFDARKGPGHDARFVTMEDLDIPPDTDLTAAFASEIERNCEIAAQSDTVAAVVGVDTRNWKFTRILISTNEPNGSENTVAHQILHLAQPLLDTLPMADGQ